MRDFITAALPWVMMGLAVAVIAVNFAREKKTDRKKQNQAQLTGLLLGMALGAALDAAGLFDSPALGMSLGALWGLALGTAMEPKDKGDGEKK